MRRKTAPGEEKKPKRIPPVSKRNINETKKLITLPNVLWTWLDTVFLDANEGLKRCVLFTKHVRTNYPVEADTLILWMDAHEVLRDRTLLEVKGRFCMDDLAAIKEVFRKEMPPFHQCDPMNLAYLIGKAEEVYGTVSKNKSEVSVLYDKVSAMSAAQVYFLIEALQIGSEESIRRLI